MVPRELICINCPMGCSLLVQVENGEVVSVTGNTCPRGAEYARNEVLHPMRMVTSVVPVKGGQLAMASCRTASPIPKEQVFEVVRQLRQVVLEAPVRIGDVILTDAAGTGVAVIATRFVEKQEN